MVYAELASAKVVDRVVNCERERLVRGEVDVVNDLGLARMMFGPRVGGVLETCCFNQEYRLRQ